jgi:hypothetical protein
VRFDSRASEAARLIAVVVLPTPPFWLAIAIVLCTKNPYKSNTYSILAAVSIIITNMAQRKAKSVSRETFRQPVAGEFPTRTRYYQEFIGSRLASRPSRKPEAQNIDCS